MKYKGLTIVLFAVVTFGFISGLVSYNRKLDDTLGKEIIQATAADFEFPLKNKEPEPLSEKEYGEEPQNQSEEILVPSLLGLREEEALLKLIELGFTADKEEAYDEDAAEGRIVSQNPEPETSAAPGSIVRFTVSLGSEAEESITEQIMVPNLIGYTKEAAEAELKELGFSVDHEYNPSEHYEEGYVYSQNYKVGALVDLGTTVKIRISTGNE
ncbi:PASTA domain-containing protein [Proteiniclasticum sp. C24MP]|uniref:PASTA domain-containing protein n=1 Tax=Proteiniclasticum sp. C24MP TaxID=3374101 RepID=UPI003754A97E